MRLDKFLKVSRLIKRRTLAKEVCDGGKVQVNGRGAKASVELKEGDLLTIDFPGRLLEVKVREIRPTVKADEAKELYEVVREEIKARTADGE